VVGVLLARWWRRRRDVHDDPAAEIASLRRHLMRAQRMEALGILSGSIMHNLNNLLSVILGQARLAREELDASSPAWEGVGQIIDAAEAASELSREVDSYHREDDHDRRPTRLQPVVRSTVKLLRDILPETVDIESDLDAACGPVLASPTQLQQVIMSLCSNAYHAMFRRRGRITITLASVSVEEGRPAIPHDLAPGHHVMLSVADNGRGMDSDTLQRMFEPYYSARAPRRGAGLGLTMVSRLLAANEGVAVAASQPGHGTRFDLYFPLIARSVRGGADSPLRLVNGREATVIEPAAYEPPAMTVLAGETAPAAAARPVHVLLVEDDAMVATTVRTSLERAEMKVTCFADGAHAVAAFAREPDAYDLLLTDQFLHGLDGREVVSEVRRLRPWLPVIIMSGHPDGIRDDDIATLNLAGTLAKPFTPTRLLATVKKALADRPRAFEGRG
jgi:nitrogen-specific signal transduction histidine kinase/CheY-like chemotaxis protein